MAQLLMPSKVTDRNRKYIRMPLDGKVIESDDEWQTCGKWIIQSPNADLDFADKVWRDLQQLLADNTLIMLKASTAANKSEGAVVICFTRPGKEEAKRAAKAIRKIVDHKGIMYYKVNKLTDAGIAQRYGHKQFTTYMSTYRGRFYVRDLTDRWMLESEDLEKNNSAAIRFYKKDYLENEELPSKSLDRFLNLGHIVEYNRSPNWFLYCSCSEDGIYLAEVDRVWLVSKKLFNEGVLSGISCIKNAVSAEIRLRVSKDRDVYSMLKHLDRIFSEASMRTIIYFRRGNEKNIIYSYKYTAEGELYEQLNCMDIFILQR